MRHALIVFKKELLDIFRDRRSLIVGLLLPVLLYPVMFTILGGTMEGIQKESTENVEIAIYGNAYADAQEIITSLMPDAVISEVANEEAAYDALNNGEVKLVVSAEHSMWGEDDAYKSSYAPPAMLTIIYDENKMASEGAASNLSALLSMYNQEAVGEKLGEMGIDIMTLYPTLVTQSTLNDLSVRVTGERQTNGSGGMMLGMLVPMMLVMMLASAGLAVAVDLFAGEKDRKTFEPLLTTKAGAFPIMMGKYAAVNVMGLVTMIMMFAGMVAGYALNPSMLTFGVEDGPALILPPLAIALVAVQILLLTMTFSGIQTAISTWSRSSKEASGYGAFLTIGSMLPAMATMYMQAGDIKDWMMFVPVLNVIATLKMILAGMLKYEMFVIGIASGVVFLVAALWFTVSLFRKEKVMFRM